MTAVDRPRFWNVPNSLTVGRLALAPVMFGLIATGRYVAALAVFGLAALSDALDGYFARLLGQSTAIGRQLDPLVDKVMVAGAYIYLMTIPGTGVTPWMVTVIVVRELLIQWLRSLIEGSGEPFGARGAGKVKTLLQCLSIAAILLALAARPAPAWLWVRDALTWSAVALTIYSGLAYLVLGLPLLQAETPEP